MDKENKTSTSLVRCPYQIILFCLETITFPQTLDPALSLLGNQFWPNITGKERITAVMPTFYILQNFGKPEKQITANKAARLEAGVGSPTSTASAFCTRRMEPRRRINGVKMGLTLYVFWTNRSHR